MTKLSRREAIHYGILTGFIFSSGFFTWSILDKNKITFLRPPGAVKDFISLCIKCGQCVQVCPFNALNLLGIDKKDSFGTPYIDSANRGCYLCELLPCILACPSGALNHQVTEIPQISMGKAYISGIDKCLRKNNKKILVNDVAILLNRIPKNVRELALLDSIKSTIDQDCDMCLQFCPMPKKAIEFQYVDSVYIPIILESCVGCGVCEEVCPKNIIKIHIKEELV